MDENSDTVIAAKAPGSRKMTQRTLVRMGNFNSQQPAYDSSPGEHNSTKNVRDDNDGDSDSVRSIRSDHSNQELDEEYDIHSSANEQDDGNGFSVTEIVSAERESD